MGSYLIEMFAVSLALTIVIELGVVYCLRLLHGHLPGEKASEETAENVGKLKPVSRNAWILPAVLVNVLTNPPAVLICWLGGVYLAPVLHFPLQVIVEVIVVVTEACVYRSFAGKPWKITRPVLLSIAANGCSWLAGILLRMLAR